MLSKIGDISRYAVRAVGLFVVISTAVVVAGFAIFGKERSLGLAAMCCLVAVASVLSWPRLPDAWRRDPPTARQLAYAEQLGIVVPQGISKGSLSDLIAQAKALRDAI